VRLTLTTLAADLKHPDSTFVEDTAVLTPHAAILCRPGAPSREGEVAAIRPELERFFLSPLWFVSTKIDSRWNWPKR
jgi:N-dimethylarginine dimethylaminohydrolase